MSKLKLVTLSLAALALLAAAALVGLRVRSGRVDDSSTAAADGAGRQTPADARIGAAQNQIRLAPERPDGHNLLAAAYMQKARESGDFGFNERAARALARSLEIAPDDYDALVLSAKLSLTFHRFREALELAERARALRPEDHDVYGAITDARVELGDYARAVEAAQRMVNLRPDAAAYARIAYLRSLHGDAEGAAEAMAVAVKASDPRDPEAVAWARVHLGDELLRLGRPAEAEREYERALATFPGYRAALVAKARERAAAGDYEAALRLHRQDDSHDRHLALGDLYAKLGRGEEARREYEAFEAAEREAAAAENDYTHLARFWADRGRNLDEALEIMRRERSRRADIFTCDALAWVFYKKGLLVEAQSAIEEALRTGTRDARIHYHAGEIYKALGDRGRALKHLRLSLEAASAPDPLQAEAARRALGGPGV